MDVQNYLFYVSLPIIGHDKILSGLQNKSIKITGSQKKKFGKRCFNVYSYILSETSFGGGAFALPWIWKIVTLCFCLQNFVFFISPPPGKSVKNFAPHPGKNWNDVPERLCCHSCSMKTNPISLQRAVSRLGSYLNHRSCCSRPLKALMEKWHICLLHNKSYFAGYDWHDILTVPTCSVILGVLWSIFVLFWSIYLLFWFS